MKLALSAVVLLAVPSAYAGEKGLTKFMSDFNAAKADPKAVSQSRCWSAEDSENYFHVKNHCQDTVVIPCDNSCDGWISFMIITENGVSEHSMCLQEVVDHKACVGVEYRGTKYFAWNHEINAWELSESDRLANEPTKDSPNDK